MMSLVPKLNRDCKEFRENFTQQLRPKLNISVDSVLANVAGEK